MKPIKIILLIVALVCLAASCKKEPVTYRFTEEDKLKLLPHYIEGKIFTFANENGETRKFKIEKVYPDQVAQYWLPGGLGGANQEYFFHEYKGFAIIDLTTQNTFGLIIKCFPVNLEEAKLNIYKKFPSLLIGSFDSNLPYYFSIEFEYDMNKTTISINGINYQNIFEILNQNSANKTGGMLIDAVKIYFDEYQGLIGFDDYYGKQWRLENSK
jgi:hypothetical protein